MNIKTCLQEIEKTIPLGQAEDFDNVGLLCGNPDREVTGILICHDALECVVEEAVAKKCNLIVAFHPIIFSGLKSLTGKNYVERAVIKAIENKIAIYAIHTAWDNDVLGVNYGLGKHLGLENLKILSPKKQQLMQLEVFVPVDFSNQVKDALFEAGAGNIGNYDECSFSIKGQGTFRPLENSKPFSGEKGKREHSEEVLISVIFENYKKNQILSAMKRAHPYEEVAYQIINIENENPYSGLGMFGELKNEMSEHDFLQFVKEKLNLQVIRHSHFIQKPIKKVGILGGSGASHIKDALKNSCDAYLTGDIKYHDFYTAEEKMLVCDIGHFESEQLISQQLYEILSKKFTTFAVCKTSESTNPVNYFS